MLISKHIDLGPALKLSSWRKVAIGTWATAKDPTAYGVLELDARPMQGLGNRTAHDVGDADFLRGLLFDFLDVGLHRHPEINCIMRFARLYPRKTVDIFFQVTNDDGKDLSGMTVREANRKSVTAIAQEMQASG